MSSTATTNAVECIVPILSVKDISVSIDYYVKVLGFKQEWSYGAASPTFAGVSRDSFSIYLCQGMPKANPGHGSGSALRMLLHSLRSIRRGALRSDRNRQTIPGHMR